MSDKDTNIVKETILKAEEMQKVVKQNTEDMMRTIISETVQKEMKKYINEDSSQPEEEDTTDTQIDDTETEETIDTEIDVDDNDLEGIVNNEDDSEWNDLSQYENEDGVYDMTNAKDEDALKIYKLMQDNDLVFVDKSDDGVEITVEEPGTFLIKNQDEMEDEEVYEVNMDEMTEALKEYNSNLGYTTKYQDKTAMTTGGVKEPGKNVNDWNKGVPQTGDDIRCYGESSESEPFTENEDVVVDDVIDEAGVSRTQRNLVRISNTNEPVKDSSRADFNDTARDGNKPFTAEQKLKQLYKEVNDIKESNITLKNSVKEYKNIFKQLQNKIEETTITNHKLGKFVKIIMEHSTTLDEKKKIVERFDKEGKTVNQINTLYESITSELKNKKPINENLNNNLLIIENSKKINENSIYVNEEVKNCLDFMNRLNKV